MSLRDVPPENEFVLLGGKRVKNVVELGREIKNMNHSVFAHHVTREKNDFANWIDACVKDTKLGTLVRMTKEQQRMAAIVERHIQEMTKPPKMTKPVVKKVEQTIPEPTIVRTKNVTLLALAHRQQHIKKEQPKQNIIRTQHKTILKLTHEQPAPKKIPEPIIHTNQIHHSKTHISLAHDQTREVYIHEVNKHHHGAALLIAHLVLGIVVGVAIAALVLAFNT